MFLKRYILLEQARAESLIKTKRLEYNVPIWCKPQLSIAMLPLSKGMCCFSKHHVPADKDLCRSFGTHQGATSSYERDDASGGQSGQHIWNHCFRFTNVLIAPPRSPLCIDEERRDRHTTTKTSSEGGGSIDNWPPKLTPNGNGERRDVSHCYKDGTRGIVGLYNNFTEGRALWEELFTELQKHGRD